MKQIGIITIHLCDNYGAILQAYALKRTVELYFPESKVKLIHYRPICWQSAEKIHFSKNSKSNIIEVERIVFYLYEKKQIYNGRYD